MNFYKGKEGQDLILGSKALFGTSELPRELMLGGVLQEIGRGYKPVVVFHEKSRGVEMLILAKICYIQMFLLENSLKKI